MRAMLFILTATLVGACGGAPDGVESSVELGAVPASLVERVRAPRYTQHARNVIVFVGDGMGISTITAGRIYDGQQRGVDGESNVLAFERLPHTALIKTYNTNQQVPDSAGTATAMFTGHKTRAGVISVGPQADRKDCAAALEHRLTTVWERAERQGLATGIVTTTRLTHATPATLYAHSPERNWEDDKHLPAEAKALGCRDIADQLLSRPEGDGAEVMLGGGLRNFLPREVDGRRRDGRDLLEEWSSGAPDRQIVRTAEELRTAAMQGQLLGLFANSHLPYELDRTADTTAPTLRQMTEAALDRLEDADNGYFLMVEGGRIDHGHHDGVAGKALAEVVAFGEAVDATLARVDLAETLVLVTADHSHVFTMGGYPTRNNPILGLVVHNDGAGHAHPMPAVDADGTPYTTLGYLNGPGAGFSGPRPMPGTGPQSFQQALVSTFYTTSSGEKALTETHAGEDVALFAGGPWAHLASGVMEQNLIHDLIVFAYGWSLEEQ
ncbi:MAG: alkaline phosphatase [Pseudomonadota bacterium]